MLAIALGNNSDAALRSPAQQDLRRGNLVLVRDRLDGIDLEEALGAGGALVGDLEEGLGAKGRVGRDGDLVLLGHGDEVGLDEVRVVLDLQGGDGVTGVGLDVVEGLGLEVGDADGLCDALVCDLLHALPGLADGDVVGLDDGLRGVHPPALCVSESANLWLKR